MNNQDRDLLTAKQAMQLFQISRVTLNEWCRKGVLEKIHIPGMRRIFIKGSSVDNIIKKK